MFWTRKRKVRMIASVGAHEAGKTYRLPVAKADEYIAKRYAQGTLSRDYTAEELNDLRSTIQTVRFT